MGKPKRIDIGDDESGIAIEYVKGKKRLDIFGFYDHFVGIEGDSISLAEFCERLGITRDDLPERSEHKCENKVKGLKREIEHLKLELKKQMEKPDGSLPFRRSV